MVQPAMSHSKLEVGARLPVRIVNSCGSNNIGAISRTCSGLTGIDCDVYTVNVSNSISSLLAEVESLSKAQFAEKYPHPWLLSEAPRIRPISASRLEIASPATAIASDTSTRVVRSMPAADEVRSQPERFIVTPVVKTERNPWLDRIMVGRAKNNDVVLDNQSVSKAQAYFTRGSAKLLLAAYQTVNPTLLNGVALVPNAAGMPVPDGAELQFANISCRYVETESLYALLAKSC